MANRQTEILKRITFSRVINVLKLYLSFWISRFFKRPIHWGTPMAISIEPTTACNLGCPECPSGLKQFTRPTGNIKPDTNQKIIDQLSPQLQYINYYFQGEPFIHPKFLDLVKLAKQKGIYVLTSTNAHFISPSKAIKIVESGLDELIVSIDGTTQDVYEDYRVHGQLSKVIDALENLKQAKESLNSSFPIVSLQFLVTSKNEHQIEDLNALKERYKADKVLLKTIQVYDYENGHRLLPKNQKYSRYKRLKNGKITLKNKMSNHCWRMWSTCVFTWDGKIVPCCFDKDANHLMGDLSKNQFKQIWRSGIYSDFRNRLLKNRESINICQNCSEGSKVWI